MTPLQTFRCVRPPAPTALVAALAMWCAWWLADQFHPQIAGVYLLPIPLAIAVRIFLLLALNWRQSIDHAQSRQVGRGYIYARWFIVAMSSLAILQLGDERTAQICYTFFIAVVGSAYFAFACFSPKDLKSTSTTPDRPLDEFIGLYTITGVGLIGFALSLIGLIDRVDDAVWVFVVSIGELFFLYLLRWIAILWLLSREDAAD